jgi:hypothetical protein
VAQASGADGREAAVGDAVDVAEQLGEGAVIDCGLRRCVPN